MLFAAAVYGNDNLLNDILNSCYRQMFLSDTDTSDLLIEAHIFEQIAFAKDVLEMRVSERDINTGPATQFLAGTLDQAGMEAAKQVLRDNARKFATRNGIKLVWMD
jgi:SOS response regulatory protein OraA/RecX